MLSRRRRPATRRCKRPSGCGTGPAVGKPDAAKVLVAPGDVHDAGDDRRRGMNRAIGLQLPFQLAGRGVERVQMHVVRADQHHVVDDRRRRFHLAAGLERPEPAAVLDAHGVHHAGKISDEDDAFRDGRRRFADCAAGRVLPAQLPRGEIDRQQVAARRPHEGDAVGDGGGRFDGVLGLVGPAQGQRGRKRARRDAGEPRVAAELGPVGRGRA